MQVVVKHLLVSYLELLNIGNGVKLFFLNFPANVLKRIAWLISSEHMANDNDIKFDQMVKLKKIGLNWSYQYQCIVNEELRYKPILQHF